MLRSIVSVVVGYLVMAVIVMVGTAVASKRLIPKNSEAQTQARGTVPTTYLAVNLIVSFLAAAAGGFACGSIAPNRSILHVIVLAGIIEALSLVTAMSTGAMPGQPTWYPWVIGIVAVGGVLLGGMFYR